MQTVIADKTIAEPEGKAFGTDYCDVIGNDEQYRQNDVCIFVYFLQLFRQNSHLEVDF